MIIKKTYKTVEISNYFRFSEVINMSLNEVLLRILKDEYGFYDSTRDYDIIWIKKDLTASWSEANGWIHIENKLV